MAALAHCFPQLQRVGLTNVDFTAKNYACFRYIWDTYPSEEEILRQIVKRCAHDGTDYGNFMCRWVPQNGVEYIVIHPTPKLNSFYVNNQSSQYRKLDLSQLILSAGFLVVMQQKPSDHWNFLQDWQSIQLLSSLIVWAHPQFWNI